jgi:hypothetical protein
MDTINHELWEKAKAGAFMPKDRFVKIRVNLWLFQTAKMLLKSKLSVETPDN